MSAATGPTGKQPKNCFTAKGSPYWQYDIVIKGRRERGSTGCIKATEAAEFVAERRVALKTDIAAKASGVPQTKGKITLSDACIRYEDDKSSKQKAAVTYKGQLDYLVALMPLGITLAEIDLASLIEYRSQRHATNQRSKPLKNSTINREIELLRRVWRYAVDLGYDCGREPNWAKARDTGAEVERIRALTDGEEKRLMDTLKTINPDLALVAEFAMITGQRKSAVVTLERDKVDFEARRATILLKTKGEADKPHTFPLTARAIEILKEFPEVDGTDRVFTYYCRRPAPARADRPARIKGERYPFSQGGWARDWQRALAHAGVRDFRFHDLRHTAATRIVAKTGNLKIAQTLLGHSDIAQTARYAHAFHDDVLAAMEKAAK
ncbi:Site-specific recombinase XerD [Sphingobium sp. AP50]|uniref:tyrosine-type recombinase/integrase n=1 Tax=Sphingobium sp. AP50 TaxID=1884369 RepID=UPI0008BECDB6|nr:site-specific integrase [Sphingobium sp. AP50]SEJ86981.1 Site-specific recombinase XerD [Sphingobium sp. AP50]